MIEHGSQPQQNGIRAESDKLPVAAAVRVAAKTVGGWLAATVFLLTISGALPAAINKYCRATNRSFRISSGSCPCASTAASTSSSPTAAARRA